MTTERAPLPPIAVIGMGLRLPGGISTAEEFWELLVHKRDGKCEVPPDRYNVESFHGDKSHWQRVATKHGYFLQHVNLKTFDASFFSGAQSKVQIMEVADPRQRLLLEVVWECMESAGQVNLEGSNTGVYVGAFGQDWQDLLQRDTQTPGISPVVSGSDFALATQLSYVFDLHGPSMTIQTGCSAATTGLHLACQALYAGDCAQAIVAGANIMMSPSMTLDMSQQGVLSATGSCKTFDAAADGYARGEAVNAILIKPLADALRDNDPIRAVIRSTAINSDGRSTQLGMPSPKCHERMIRKAYEVAGISDFSETAYVECHGTGTRVGDPLEVAAIASVFGEKGVYIGSVKPNVGHSEGASGLTSVIKAILALERRTIPPNINYSEPNPKIPMEAAHLSVPVEPVSWPSDRSARVSVNSFGIGGANAHVILEAAHLHIRPNVTKCCRALARTQRLENGTLSVPNSVEDKPVSIDVNDDAAVRHDHLGSTIGSGTPDDDWLYLLPTSASCKASLDMRVDGLQRYIQSHPNHLESIAHTMSNRRTHLRWRSICIHDKYGVGPLAIEKPEQVRFVNPRAVFIFTGQGSQWAGMAKELARRSPSFRKDLELMDATLQALPSPPQWSITSILSADDSAGIVDRAEYAQPLCVAVQVGLVRFLANCNIKPCAVIGHSSGEIAAAYAAGAITMPEAIICGYMRGQVVAQQSTGGAMATVSLGKLEISPHLMPGVQIACENSQQNVTISGHEDAVDEVLQRLSTCDRDISAVRLPVKAAYHSEHMSAAANDYEKLLEPHLSPKPASLPWYSTVTGQQAESDCGDYYALPRYWKDNLANPVLFHQALACLVEDMSGDTLFLEIGPHPTMRRSFHEVSQAHWPPSKGKKPVYEPTLVKGGDSLKHMLLSLGRMYMAGYDVDFSFVNPATAVTLTDLPNYPWDHSAEYWSESRLSRAWRFRKHPSHELLGSSCLEASELNPTWRNLLRLQDVPWLMDHKIGRSVVFPCAGYVAMMGEAIRQVTGSQKYTLRNVKVKAALVVPERGCTELMTTMRALPLTDYTASAAWYSIEIASFNGTSWVQNCVAQGRAGQDPSSTLLAPTAAPAASCCSYPRRVPRKAFYEQAQKLGIHFGPHFQRLQSVAADTKDQKAAATILSEDSELSLVYAAHPIILDACLQLCSVAAYQGVTRRMNVLKVPTSIDSVTVAPRRHALTAKAAIRRGLSGSLCADVEAVTTDAGEDVSVIAMQGINSRLLESEDDGQVGATSPTIAHIEWRPDIELLRTPLLARCKVPDSRKHKVFLERLTAICIVLQLDVLETIQTPITSVRLLGHVAWLRREKAELAKGMWDIPKQEVKQWLDSDSTALRGILLSACKEIEALGMQEASLFATIASHLTEAANIVPVFTELADPFSRLVSGTRTLPGYNGISNGLIDVVQFAGLFAHSRPMCKILQIGAAGDGEAISDIILKSMTSEVGTPIYSEYVVTSQGPLKTVEHFEQSGVTLADLDITRDPVQQGFALADYDLVITSNLTCSIPPHLLSRALQHIRSLLKPGGRLLLEDLTQPSKWRFPQFVMGLTSHWYVSQHTNSEGYQEGHQTAPPVSQQEWNEAFLDAGFSGVDSMLADDPDVNYQTSQTILTTAAANVQPPAVNAITLLYHDRKCEFATELSSTLQQQGIEVLWKTLTQLDQELASMPDDIKERPNALIVSTVDLEAPYLSAITEEEYDLFKSVVFALSTERLVWLTRASQVGCTDPRHGLFTGLARNLRHESTVNLWTIELSDLALESQLSVSGIVQKIYSLTGSEGQRIEYEYVVKDGIAYTGRYHWTPLANEPVVQLSDEYPTKMIIQSRSNLDSLSWTKFKPAPLTDDDVEISVRYTALNFRDIMIAMGFIEGESDGLGFEASGVVMRVGCNVAHVTVGDDVAVIGSGLFATKRIVPGKSVVRIPGNLTLEEAATMPIAFTTAIYSLITVGQIERGQSVLIHSACGAVGLASIQICRAVGAEIYASVGDDAKVDYLVEHHNIPRERIFNSRNVSFVSGIMQATNDRGVDVVLNSLSGDLLHASWQCVAKRGKMLEIGKRDILERGHVPLDLFQHNRSFYGIDLDGLFRESPDEGVRLLEQVVEMIDQGSIRPISRYQTFPSARISDAFRHMTTGKHIGKILIAMEDNERRPRSLPSMQELVLSPTSTYLLVGGLGGLGRAVASWLAERGATSLVFLSRSAGHSKEDKEFLKELESQGCQAITVAGSVADEKDVQLAVAAAPSRIAGVLQMSMVSRNALLADMTYDDWVATQAPKVDGTWNLHKALLGTSLDFFVLFSSLAGVLGLPYQANYASANTFLDSFMQYRHSLGQPCSVLDLGAVEGIGFISYSSATEKQYRDLGAYMVREKELLDAVQICIQQPMPPAPSQAKAHDRYINWSQIAVGMSMTRPVSDPTSPTPFRVDVRMAMYQRMDSGLQASSGADQECGFQRLLKRLDMEPSLLLEDDVVSLLMEELRLVLCRLMVLSPENVSQTATLASIGIDSLVSIEIRNWWRRTLGTDISVLEIIQAKTLPELGRMVISSLKKKYAAEI